MTTQSGPIPLTVVTLYCRTADAVCEHWRAMTTWTHCAKADLGIYVPRTQVECKAPPWCPLAGKAVPHVD